MTLRDKGRHAAQVGALLAARPSEAKRIPMWLRERRRPTVESRLPWLPFEVIRRMDRVLTPASRVFEYGGGGSTLWFAQRAGEVVTVEHDRTWFDLLDARCASLTNVRLLHEPEPKSAGYTAAAVGGEWDLVVVDGRERVACVREAMGSVVPGGMLVLDDTERAKYQLAFELLADWRCETVRGLAVMKPMPAQSTIWTRPV